MIRIHYLMGCHSTPLYSHLHVPSVLVDAWTLDCSPECRASTNVGCESDLFSNDPGRFVDTVYRLKESESDTCISDEEYGYCSFQTKQVPDLLVVYSREAFLLREQFAAMGLELVDSFAHGINGVQVRSFEFGSDFGNDAFRHVSLLGWIELSLNDMLLFAKPHVVKADRT